MLDEHDEFLISRLNDKDLSREERERLDHLLATHPEAEALAREYRQLGGILHLARETPKLDFDALRANIMSEIEDREAGGSAGSGRETSRGETSLREPSRRSAPATGGRDFWTSGGRALSYRVVAVAACMLLALGLSWQLMRTAIPGDGGYLRPDGSQLDGAEIGVGLVTRPGANVELPGGGGSGGSIVVEIGPSGKVAGNPSLNGQAGVRREGPSRVAIDPGTAPASQPGDAGHPF